jgi:hypothetical protein
VGGRFALRGFAPSDPILVVMRIGIAESHGDPGRDSFLRDAALEAMEGAMNNLPNHWASLDAATTFCLYSRAHWRRASDPARSPL